MNRRDFLKIVGVSAFSGSILDLFASQNRGTKKRLVMVIDTTKPFDMQVCIDACRKAHNIPEIKDTRHKVRWIWPEKFSDVFSEQIEAPKEMVIPVLCNHCENPPCTRVCPTKATFKRKDGIVMMDYHRCIGCRFCMAACPYGARSFNWIDPRRFVKDQNPVFPTRTKGVVEKCNLCAERLDKGQSPACVEVSDNGIIFGDISEMRNLLSNRYCLRRKLELGTSPSVYYLI
ncbi:4Fe-4S dicluster domain-containing protein [bacterium]|nr:4Fe-4S dicluster domain-containing protein [bacterium]MBU1599233.1 4Fe-4S dicluster domain-containing protein [bacterium]MBU2461487.1 4Fe-4S dicluster domain-containing protein [bacterium]